MVKRSDGSYVLPSKISAEKPPKPTNLPPKSSKDNDLDLDGIMSNLQKEEIQHLKKMKNNAEERMTILEKYEEQFKKNVVEEGLKNTMMKDMGLDIWPYNTNEAQNTAVEKYLKKEMKVAGKAQKTLRKKINEKIVAHEVDSIMDEIDNAQPNEKKALVKKILEERKNLVENKLRKQQSNTSSKEDKASYKKHSKINLKLVEELREEFPEIVNDVYHQPPEAPTQKKGSPNSQYVGDEGYTGPESTYSRQSAAASPVQQNNPPRTTPAGVTYASDIGAPPPPPKESAPSNTIASKKANSIRGKLENLSSKVKTKFSKVMPNRPKNMSKDKGNAR